MANGKKSTEKTTKSNDTGASLGFEAQLWAGADALDGADLVGQGPIRRRHM